MRLIAKVDAAVLRAIDAAVQWAWNRLAIRRIALIRLLMSAFVIGVGLSDVSRGGVTVGTVFVILVALSCGVAEEFYDGFFTPRVANARMLIIRNSPIGRLVRAIALVIGVGAVLEPSGAFLVFGAANLLVGQSLTPEGPRKPRKRRAASTKLAMGTGGAA